ncbi:MAG TPA: exodeoxyribonuclease VII large subunit, partial [Burkholderiales bacterium]|nr:exodeoxyribonuclease VII large subunit [Burkholderiales bacterium]
MQRSDPFTPSSASPARDVYSVSRLNREIKALLEGSFPILWVEGEISNLSRPASGHAYFSLKDGQAQVRCCLFRGQMRGSNVALKDGLRVVVRARVSLYEQRGDFQLIAEHVEEAGEGALRQAFEMLKQRLAQEGLFDVAHKKPLPRLPRRIGLITSSSGAVVHDILTTLRRRFPAIAVALYPVPVQGDGAAQKIAAAIAFASRRGDCDALILARGGGSLEDLWPFNEEAVARAIYACTLPLVSGVGHETDFTIADLVADARAPTPTAAAEMLSPDRHDWLEQYRRLEQRLRRCMQQRLGMAAQHVDWLSARLIHPQARIETARATLRSLTLHLRLSQGALLARLHRRLDEARADLQNRSPGLRVQAQRLRQHHLTRQLLAQTARCLERADARFKRAAQSLDTLSPLATLARGYAIVERVDDGAVMRDAASAKPGDRVRARLARGEIECRVEKTRES